MYQLYLYFEANTCLQEMAHWSRCAVQNHTAKINSVWFVPHLPNFKPPGVSDNEHSVSKFPYVWFK